MFEWIKRTKKERKKYPAAKTPCSDIFFRSFFLYSRTNSNAVTDNIMYLFGNSFGIDYDICNPFILCRMDFGKMMA